MVIKPTQIFLLCLIASCFQIGCDLPIGGGGIMHKPPDSAMYGESIKLSIEPKVSGQGAEKLSSRYTSIVCHYKYENASSFQKIPFTIISENDEYLLLECDIPPLQASDGDYVEYYIDMYFDGHYNRLKNMRVVIKK